MLSDSILLLFVISKYATHLKFLMQGYIIFQKIN